MPTISEFLHWFFDPDAWVALVSLIVLEIILGIDNLIFVSILTNRLPEAQRPRARQVGMGMAVLLRLGLLGLVTIIVKLTQPVFTILGHGLSWRDLVLIAGGLFLIWKATGEIHHHTLGDDGPAVTPGGIAGATMGGVVLQIIVLDLVFSLDSIITAVGMTDDVSVMVTAVVISVACMLAAVGPLSRFIGDNPTIVMLALGFLLMIGTALLADGMGFHVPKGYIYASMGFAALIEALNLVRRRRRQRRLKREASGE
jgi:predicted tellurium resistance membrane protein TerC